MGTHRGPFASIHACGAYTPPQVLTNDDLIRRLGLPVDAQWIESRTGIKRRHWMRDDQTTSDLAVEAARAVLARAETDARDLDRIVLATTSPDHLSPSTATIVARKLGARCAAVDISAASAGFLYALDIGAAFVRTGARRVLVLAADARSRFVDPLDLRSVVMFADGAAGALVEPAEEPGLWASWMGAEGRENMGAHIPAGGACKPASPATVEAREHYLRVDDRSEIFELSVKFTREACARALAQAGMTMDDIDVYITHQGNAHMAQAVLYDLGIDPERAIDSVEQHGNASGATLPIALAEAVDAGRVRSGSKVLLSAVGAGYTFGAAIHEF
jgi:3-oxoacyl-[acyl-carrier-protein] synthase-3